MFNCGGTQYKTFSNMLSFAGSNIQSQQICIVVHDVAFLRKISGLDSKCGYPAHFYKLHNTQYTLWFWGMVFDFSKKLQDKKTKKGQSDS